MVQQPAARPQPLDAALGARIRELRLRRRLSLRELARRLGVSAATVSQIEHGRTGVTVARLAHVAEVLDAAVAELVSPAPDRVAAPEPAPAGRARPVDAAGGADWRSFPPIDLDPVLTAALEAFLDVGYAGASVRDIARRCDLSVPGLYHHYASKQDMLVELLDTYLDSLWWRTTAARDEGADPVERFARIVECLALHHTYRRALAFVGLSEMRSLEPANRDRIRRLRNRQQRMVDVEATAAHRLGRFTTPHPRDASRAVVTMCTSIPHWYRAGGPDTPEEIARRYVRFALDLMRLAPDAPQ
ncbi:TetR family transcriptional regulator [Phytohabitans kaempferiae]|uniref:TetR family transcriptional regulator n=1 Tax=Phytohabitans kaempferiae TaxID=1620943 RepID=A0ABV6M633_9ACTN